MRMQFDIELTQETANFFGEYFRNQFFDPKLGYGCYQNFDLAPGVVKLPDRVEEAIYFGVHEKEIWTCAKKSINGLIIKMEYHWYGDGTLIFYHDCREGHDFRLVNDDCKKDNNWELV